MSDTPERHEAWLELFDAMIDGTACAADAEKADRLIRENPEARRLYTQLMHQHASLRWHNAQASATAPRPVLGAIRPARRWTGWLWAAGVALCVFGGALGWWAGRGATAPRPVAVLLKVEGCTWRGGDLPTTAGAALPAGTLRLAEGIASLQFASGARLELEGPAVLELASPMKCILREGIAVAHVPPEAKGFTVDTPSAKLVDHGTSFGVSVDREGRADVEVFDGRVDVHHVSSGERRELRDGARARVGSGGIEGPQAVEARRVQGPASAPAPNVVTITTAMGRGKDAFVEYSPKSPGKDYPSETVLMVKHNPREWSYTRKAYLGFDLASIAGRTVSSARLVLTVEPSGRGFNGDLPDAEFEVFGLTDASLDGWDPAMDWDTAPANQRSDQPLDPAKAVSLGTFTVPRGMQQGVRVVQSEALAKFLGAQSDGLATIVVVRRTPGSQSGSLVHGFASRRHPTAAPPTLKLSLEP